MLIGEPLRRWVIEPLEEPVPADVPVPDAPTPDVPIPEPSRDPELEPAREAAVR